MKDQKELILSVELRYQMNYGKIQIQLEFNKMILLFNYYECTSLLPAPWLSLTSPEGGGDSCVGH